MGAEVCFLCRRLPGDLISLLEQEFVVLPLTDHSLTACDGLKARLIAPGLVAPGARCGSVP